MEYKEKTSRQIISDLCVSGEFEEFKDSLKLFNDSIEKNDIENVFESLVTLGKSRDMMLSRLNLAFKYKIEKYLTKAQIEEIDMEGNGDGVSLVYKKYIPSYKKDGIYTSIDSTLLVVDLKNSEIYMPDIVELFTEAQKYSKQDRVDEKTKLELRKQKINEMKFNRESISYVVSTVKGQEDKKIKYNTLEKVKCLTNKNTKYEYMQMYDEILIELEEDYKIREKDFKLTKAYDYEEKLSELRDLQEGLVRRLSAMNFIMKYENQSQKINITKSPLNILNIYK